MTKKIFYTAVLFLGMGLWLQIIALPCAWLAGEAMEFIIGEPVSKGIFYLVAELAVILRVWMWLLYDEKTGGAQAFRAIRAGKSPWDKSAREKTREAAI